MSIVRSSYVGEAAITAVGEQLAVTVAPSLGGKLVSLVHRPSGVELLRQPSSREEYQARPILFGAPILFPPNRIADGRFQFADQTYQFDLTEPSKHNHIHGFVAHRPWQAETVEGGRRTAIVVTFDSAHHPEVLRQLPQRFTIVVEYVLDGPRLIKRATVENHSERPLPFGFGYHTTFRFPLADGGHLKDCRFSLPVSKQWQLDARNLPTGRQDPVPASVAENLPLAGVARDDVFSTAAGVPNRAVLRDDAAGLKVHYDCAEPFRFWVVYNADGKQGFLCPEPYTWVTNAPNLALPADETGMSALEPGERRILETSIAVLPL
ncbi:aldose 1-epimerase [Alicyclobacillus shizuokensis]|uniref:aldose 1-epimerase n=1 Tax=Alicyclobacillus shizuokensis TaxID=392014 RepID=UPI00083578A5|nr:aldose 1-epimerase [Alicyclobacillus shizuokensis]MCL6625915.1 aldose 1-epimerase [Alicyclobacillus shizuokensis]